MNKKYKLEYCEFHITSACNLSCTGCDRFSDYSFKHTTKPWNEVKELYIQWSKQIDIDDVDIIGGEPTINKDLPNWLYGLREVWPDSNLAMSSNGTRLNFIPNLYDILKDTKCKVRVSLHDINTANNIISDIKDLLVGPLTIYSVFPARSINAWKISYNNIKVDSWPDCDTPYEFKLLPNNIQQECIDDFSFSFEHFTKTDGIITITDINDVCFVISPFYYFHQAAIYIDDKNMKLHNNNPDDAIEVCEMKKCHNFVDGKLYKCPVMGTLPEFIKQYDLDITEEDKILINSYKPCSINDDSNIKDKFFNDILNYTSIEQCKFCPDVYNMTTLHNI